MSNAQNDVILDDFREWLELHADPFDPPTFHNEGGKRFVFNMRQQEFIEVPENFADLM